MDDFSLCRGGGKERERQGRRVKIKVIQPTEIV